MSFLLGLGGIFYGLYFVFTYPKSGFSGYFDLPSLVLLGLVPPRLCFFHISSSDFLDGTFHSGSISFSET